MSFGLEIILGRGKRRVRNEHLVLDLPDGGSLGVEHVQVDQDLLDQVERVISCPLLAQSALGFAQLGL